MHAINNKPWYDELGFSESPFSITPDTSFFFANDGHVEALSTMFFAATAGGLCVISGEVGLGKTLLCRSLLNKLDSTFNAAYIFNPMQDPLSLLKTIYYDFTGSGAKGENISEVYNELNEYLLDIARAGTRAVLIIDEAQLLSEEALQTVRLVTNLETEKKKLLSLILVGQPELCEILASKAMRPLQQRVSYRYQLRPLTMSQSFRYIEHRFAKASVESGLWMTNAAKLAAHKCSGGVPRRLNQVCERAILSAYVAKKSSIDVYAVYQSAREILAKG
ncbi:MAG: AAA family ATPase [Gammaproteobacteria bacterium]|nr:AAA family ATPase [Gammaproteobacteria bacterium]